MRSKTTSILNVFRSQTEFLWNRPKKCSQFGHNVRKRWGSGCCYAEGFLNSALGQMTETSQRKKAAPAAASSLPLFQCTFDKITKETDAASYNATDQLQCDLEKEPRLTCCRKAFLKAGWMSWSKIESFSHSWPDREFIFPRCGRQTCPTMLLSIPMQLQKHRRGCSRGFAVQSCLQKC